MTKSLLLFKTLYKDVTADLRREKGQKRVKSGSVGMMIAFVPIILIVAAMAGYVASTVKDDLALAYLVCIAVIAVQFIATFLSLGAVFSTLYGAKDAPLLQSLPIKSVDVFFAKFTLVYVTILKMTALMLLPILYSMLIGFNIANGRVFYGAYALTIIVTAVAPVLPLFIVTLFSLPITWIGSFIKGKPTLKSIMTVLVYVLIMCAYMVLVYFMNTKGFGQKGDDIVTDRTIGVLATFATVVYSDKTLVFFAMGIDAGKNFGISVGITVAMIAVSILLAGLFYRRIISKKGENSAQDVNKTENFKQQSVVISLAKRDLTMIVRNSSLAMSSFANMLMAPIFIVVSYFITGFKESGAEGEMPALMSEMLNIGYIVMYSMIFLAGANMLANQAYTREGKSFFATKTLPIKPKDSIKSKLLLACGAASVIMIPVMLIAILLYKIDIVSTLFAGIDTMLMVLGVCSLSILFDMKKGNQHWETTAELRTASRGNVYQIITAFLSLIPAMALFALGMVLAAVCENLGEVLVKTIFWAVATLISVAVCIAGVLVLKDKGEKWYEYIGENKPNIYAIDKRKNRNYKGLIK